MFDWTERAILFVAANLIKYNRAVDYGPAQTTTWFCFLKYLKDPLELLGIDKGEPSFLFVLSFLSNVMGRFKIMVFFFGFSDVFIFKKIVRTSESS